MGRRLEVLQLWDVQAHGLTLQKPKEGQRRDVGSIKRSGRPMGPWPAFYNKYSVLYGQNKMDSNHHTERKVRWTLKPLREVWLNIRLERIDTYHKWSLTEFVIEEFFDSQAR